MDRGYRIDTDGDFICSICRDTIALDYTKEHRKYCNPQTNTMGELRKEK